MIFHAADDLHAAAEVPSTDTTCFPPEVVASSAWCLEVERGVNAIFVAAKVKRVELQRRARRAIEHAVNDVNGVLAIGHQNSFLQTDALPQLLPHRQAGLEAAIHDRRGHVGIGLAAGALLVGEIGRAIANHQPRADVVEHHHPSGGIR